MWPLTQGAAWELWPCGLYSLARLLDLTFQETFQAPYMTLHLGWVGSWEASCPGREVRCSLASRADQNFQALVEV